MTDQLTPEEIEQLRERSREAIGNIPVTWRELNCLLDLHDKNQQMLAAISNAISYANNRESEWGERAEDAFSFLYHVMRQTQ